MRRILLLLLLLVLIQFNFERNTVTFAFSQSDFFYERNVEKISELKGKTFKGLTKKISKSEFEKLIENPLSFVLFDDRNFCGIISAKKNLLTFPIHTTEDFRTQLITSYDLSSILSNDLKIRYVSCLVKGRMLERVFIMDYGKNILISLTCDNQILRVVNAIKFKSDIRKIDIICGIVQNDTMKILGSNNGEISVLENDSFKLLKTNKFANWNTVWGYSRINKVYLYQVDNNTFRKYDLSNDKVIYEHKMKDTPIKGKITRVATDKLDLLYILTDFNNKSALYKTNEKSFSRFSYTDTFEDGNKFGKINEVNYFSTEKGGMGLCLFQVDSLTPIKTIDLTSPVWKEINSGTKNDDNKISKKDTEATSVITDVANWNHPVKEAFVKFGFSLTKIEFYQNGKYPVFYVENNSKCDIDDENFDEMVANKNGYWSFEVRDKNQRLVVVCDKTSKVIKNRELFVE